MTDDHTTRIKRLIYRSAYTGTKETDLLLGAFARDVLPGMAAAELDAYEELLDAGDPLIWAWASGQEKPPANMDNPALNALIAWAEGRQG